MEYGFGDGLALLRETDHDALLAAQAVIEAGQLLREEHYERLAQHIVATLGKALKK